VGSFLGQQWLDLPDGCQAGCVAVVGGMNLLNAAVRFWPFWPQFNAAELEPMNGGLSGYENRDCDLLTFRFQVQPFFAAALQRDVI
jgi:hypothetical protein